MLTWPQSADRGLEIVGGRLGEVRLGRDRDQLLARLARLDRAPAVARSPPTRRCRPCRRAVVSRAGAKTTPSRRRAVVDQPDVDGVIVAAADELLGAVERVDEEIGVAVRRDSPGRDFLLGDHRNARRGARQRGEDDQLGRAVRFGDRRWVAAWPRPRTRAGRSSRIASPGFPRRDAQSRRASCARPRLTRRHPDAAVEPHRGRVHIGVLDHEAGQLAHIPRACPGASGTAPARRARPAHWAASSPPSAS